MGKLKSLSPRVATVETRKVVPPPKRADPELRSPQHQRFREVVLKRAGYRCQWVEDGVRCTRSEANGDRLIADHMRERADGGAPFDPDNGQCLCVQHNTLKGVQARAARR